MRKVLRTLKGYTRLILRDIGRKLAAVPEGRSRTQMEERMTLVDRLLRQTLESAGKLLALHEPEVDCLSEGKAQVRYEFGSEVSVATTLTGGFVVDTRSMPGNPCNGHTFPMPFSRSRPSLDPAPVLPWSIVTSRP